MRVLFAFSHPGFLRNFESGLRHLLRRGHDVHVVIDRDASADSVGGAALQVLDRIGGEGRLTRASAPGLYDSEWTAFAGQLRTARDYWRYLDATYDSAPLLRARAAAEAPSFATLPVWRLAPLRAVADRLVHTLERRLPVPEALLQYLDEQRPDVVVLTPLVYVGSDQVQWLRAARRRGIPVVYAAGSWDHLTTKGLLHERPDLAVLWNEAQIEECARFHGVPREACAMSGAQAFDHWFDQRPSIDAVAFRREAGLPPDGPLLLYLCSSPFIAGDERPQVREWLAAIRRAPAPLAGAGVLIRPHPQNAEQWRDEQLADDRTAIWPRAGANPVAAASRADFFHSLYFSDAVVGVNTSAQIESAIVGRPVFTVTGARYAGTQEGTLHFRLLREAGGGLLHVASSFDKHVAQVCAALANIDEARARSRAFVRAFVRPVDAERAAGEVFAELVERVPRAAAAPGPLAGPALLRWLRPLAQAADAAGKLRAVQAPPRFQSWFLPAARVFRPEHMPGRQLSRLAVVTPAEADVERLVSLSGVVAAGGGRILLCVPDGSEAGAAVKRLHGRLARVVPVGLSPATGSGAMSLVLRKFRPEGLLVFEESAGAPLSRLVMAAARRLEVPVARVSRQCTEAEVFAAFSAHSGS